MILSSYDWPSHPQTCNELFLVRKVIIYHFMRDKADVKQEILGEFNELLKNGNIITC